MFAFYRLTLLLATSTLVLLLVGGQASALTLGQAAQVAQTAQISAFNTVEMVAYNADNRVPQWNRVKAALQKDTVKLQNCLDDVRACTTTAMQGWRTMVNTLKSQDKNTQLGLVNSFFNQWQYRSDSESYGVAEYWASPLEFMANSGDCEDYAIAKYVTLTFLGFGDSEMRIIALVDNNRGGIGHSVLSVSLNGQRMILDNLTASVYPDGQQTGYTPRFAVNQAGVYTYTQQPRMITASYQKQ